MAATAPSARLRFVFGPLFCTAPLPSRCAVVRCVCLLCVCLLLSFRLLSVGNDIIQYVFVLLLGHQIPRVVSTHYQLARSQNN